MEHKLLGECLLELGKIEPEDIQEALLLQATWHDHAHKPLIGDVLIELGVVDQEDINVALAEQEFARMGIPA